ncbi:unnamed protein product [Pylaiella littoralis]
MGREVNWAVSKHFEAGNNGCHPVYGVFPFGLYRSIVCVQKCCHHGHTGNVPAIYGILMTM